MWNCSRWTYILKSQCCTFIVNETTNEESGFATLDLVHSERLSRTLAGRSRGGTFLLWFDPRYRQHILLFCIPIASASNQHPRTAIPVVVFVAFTPLAGDGTVDIHIEVRYL